MFLGPESARVRKELQDFWDFFKASRKSEKEKELERTAEREQQEMPQLGENAISNQTHELDETT